MPQKLYKPRPESNTYIDSILIRLRKRHSESGLTKQQIADTLGWPKTAVTRVFKYTADSFILSRVLDVATALGMDFNELMVDQTEKILPADSTMIHSNLQKEVNLINSHSEGIFITNPDDKSFYGIMNEATNPNDFYRIYTPSTVPEESNVILKGKLRLTKDSNESGIPYCKAVLTLYTGKFDKSGAPEKKLYNGELIISHNMRYCYIILFGRETAEINLLTFEHRYFNYSNLDCKLVGCHTVSAGEYHRSTHVKMIISRNELSDKHLSDLKGILNITEPNLMIPKAAIDNSDEKDDIMTFLNKFDVVEEVYYRIADKQLLSGSSDKKDLENLVLMLRNLSNSPPYVKVSDTENTLLYHYYKETFLQ